MHLIPHKIKLIQHHQNFFVFNNFKHIFYHSTFFIYESFNIFSFNLFYHSIFVKNKVTGTHNQLKNTQLYLALISCTLHYILHKYVVSLHYIRIDNSQAT